MIRVLIIALQHFGNKSQQAAISNCRILNCPLAFVDEVQHRLVLIEELAVVKANGSVLSSSRYAVRV